MKNNNFPLTETQGETKEAQVGSTFNFSNGERTLLKLKINEMEKELKELRTENEFIHKNLVEVTSKQVEDFKAKTNKTQGLDATNKSIIIGKLKQGISKVLVKDYNENQIVEIIREIMV